jgi:2-succinyl-6-hydroxy-2,4-cyclohexadiene-1-carboxylate synthase
MNVILALHGFLGSPRDFDPLATAFAKWNTGYEIIAVDYTNLRGLTPDVSLDRWGENFNLWSQKNYSKKKKVIMGYSQGGRLALHAVEKNSTIWSKAILLSTNPGLQSPEEKKSRKENDLRWSHRFQNVDFDRVVKEWNAQGVFMNSQSEPVRRVEDFDSELLGKALTHWSLAEQKDFRKNESVFKTSGFWMAGEFDNKYKDLILGLKQLEMPIQTAIVEGASHRLMLDQPEKTAEYLKSFLQE